MNVLVVDVGGSHIKVLLSGESKRRKISSGPWMTPARMVRAVEEIVSDWTYDAVSIGYPGLVVHGRIAAEPDHLAVGWIGFDFHAAFDRPVKIVNDAAMQALGGYTGGRMLFLGLGTGLGSAMIVDGHLAPMELAHLPYKKGRSYEDYVGRHSLEHRGKKRWRKHVADVVERLTTALEPDYVVIGGGNAKRLDRLPVGARRGKNADAFTGGFRLWPTDTPDPVVLAATVSLDLSGWADRRGTTAGRSAPTAIAGLATGGSQAS